jgi:tRNA threonylcarbamoyladenosine biosynthesis protein TsaB
MTLEPGAPQSIPVVILTLDTTTRAGSCAVWRGDGIVDEMVGNPEKSHAQRLPNELAKLLANHRLKLKDVTLYAIASGPGSFTGLRVGISTMQSLALVHDRLIVPISSLEALAYCAAREDPTRARPGTFIGTWMEAYRGEVFCALYRVRHGATLIESTDPLAGQPPPERIPQSIAPLPPIPPKAHMSLALLEEVVAPAVGTPDEMADAWALALADQDPAAAGGTASLLVIGDAVHGHRGMLTARLPMTAIALLDNVPIAGMIAELAAREPHRGVTPYDVVPLYLRRPMAELARERVEQLEQRIAAAKQPPPDWRRRETGNGSGNGNGASGSH